MKQETKDKIKATFTLLWNWVGAHPKIVMAGSGLVIGFVLGVMACRVV